MTSPDLTETRVDLTPSEFASTSAATLPTPPNPTADQLTLEVHSDSDWPQVRLWWSELEDRIATLQNGVRVPLVVSSIWTDMWLRHYGDLVPHRFLIAKHAGRIVSIVLLTEGVQQYDGPINLRTRHFGTAGEPDADSVVVEDNTLLSEPVWKWPALRLFVQHVRRQWGWREFRFDGVTDEEGLRDAFGNPNHIRVVPGHYLDLELVRESGETIDTHFGRSSRQQLRRCVRHFEGAETHWAETIDEAMEYFDRMVALHQERWTDVGEPGVYSSDRFLNFHRELIPALFPEGRVMLTRVAMGQRVLSCQQMWLEDRRVLNYQGGNTSTSDKKSPGLVADFLNMEESLRRGYDAYDFLGGDTFHKRRYSNAKRDLLWLSHRRFKVRRALLNVGRTLKRKLHEYRERSATDATAEDNS